MLPSYAKPQADRAAGILWGLAAGDRNGGPLRLSLRMLTAVLDKGAFDMAQVATSYLAWWKEGAFDTGATTAAALQKLQDGLALDRAAAQVHRESGRKTAGCSPAHRIAPLAAVGFVSDERLRKAAFEDATITHYDPRAGEAAVAVAMLCRFLLQGQPWDEARREASFGRHFTIASALEHPAPRDALQADGFAPHVLQAALHFLTQHPTFDDALSAALAFAGPANFSPVLVGAIGGARWGLSAIPEAHLAHATDLFSKLTEISDALAPSWD